MSLELRLTNLGEGIDEVDVVEVCVHAGESIAIGDAIIEVESEKATVEVPAERAGLVLDVHVKAGQTIAVGEVLLTIEVSVDVARAISTPSNAVSESDEDRVALEATDRARSGDALHRGPPTAHFVPPVERGGDGLEETSGGSELSADAHPVPAAPSVRTFAREIGVDVRRVEGQGPVGRISIDDVKKHARMWAVSLPFGMDDPLPEFERWGHVRRAPMGRLRRTLAKNLARSWSTVPHVTIFGDADVTEVEGARVRHRGRAEELGAKLTVTAFVLQVVAAALKAQPKLNSSIDLRAGEIVYKSYCNLGVATDTDRGLLVPVIRDVDQKGVFELAVEMMSLAERARSGSLLPEEMEGATFTVSNLGGLGARFFTPLLNTPEVGVLGVGRAEPQPVIHDGSVQARLMMPLSLSFDHRAIDGADGARFLACVVDALERPMTWAMEHEAL